MPDRSHPPLVSAPAQFGTCCHHLCDWKSYVGKEFFHKHGLGAAEFDALRKASSWAVSGRSDDDFAAKAQLGKLAKLFIDEGRMHACRAAGLRTELTKYVEASQTPENTLLLARFAQEREVASAGGRTGIVEMP